MSWRKKKKEIHKIKRKFNLMIYIVGMIAIILIALLCLKICNGKFYSIKPRVKDISKNEVIKNSNYKTMAWLRVQGTKIDMPIIRSDTPEEGFPADLENYAWSQNRDDKFHNSILVMGHNIFNLSSTPKISSNSFNRLEELMAFVYYDFAKENKYIQYTVDGKDYIYKIYSVGFISTSPSTTLPSMDDMNKEETKERIKKLKELSIYDYDVDINENDKLISLSTCTRFFGTTDRTLFYVNGRLLREGEKIKNYKVSKNELYDEVLKKLKGDENNESDNI